MSSKGSKKQKLNPGGDAERLNKACKGVLKELKGHPQAYAFLAPVDWKALKLPQYPKLIKTPMDLGTVEQKLTAGRYANVSDFGSDVGLIWKNAFTFNIEGSEIYHCAQQMKIEFDNRMAQLGDGLLREGGGGGKMGGAASASGGGGADDELARCKAALKELRKHKDAGWFLEPVDWKQLNIPDYPTIIKRPMDLGTVTKRIDAGQYHSAHEVAADIDLVWRNAMTYNQDESTIYMVARDMKAVADKKMAPILALARPVADAPSEITWEMKRKLNENSGKLSSKDLYGMVGIVEESCKQAIDQTNPQEVEIDVDELDPQTFHKVSKYVEDCLSRGKKRKGA